MTQKELLTLEELLTKAHTELGQYQTYQVGRYIVQPIYWGEHPVYGIIPDEDSIRDEFDHFFENELSMDFVDSE
jgi:hypothetical protein